MSKCIFLHSIQFILLTLTKHCIHIEQTIRNFSEKIQFDSTEKNRCAAIFVHTIVCVCVDSILDVRSNGPKGNKLHMLLYFWCRWCWLLTAVVSPVRVCECVSVTIFCRTQIRISYRCMPIVKIVYAISALCMLTAHHGWRFA